MCFRGENVKNINIAVNICTYHRNDFVEHNISKLLQSKFFDLTDRDYYGKLHIFVIDNGCELECHDGDFFACVSQQKYGRFRWLSERNRGDTQQQY
jgi:hypothetical protein